MQIVLVLLVLAALIVAALAATLLGALLVGGVASLSKHGRIARPVFFVVVPMTVLGALAGGALVGNAAVRANENLLVLGPLAGLAVGTIIGLSLGLLGAGFWWWRMYRCKGSRRRMP